MFRLFSKSFFVKLFNPPDTNTGGANPPTEMGKEDMIEFLNDDEDDNDVIEIDEKPKAKDKGKPKSTPEKEESPDDKSTFEDEDEIHAEEGDEEDELAEIEAELEGPNEEQLELVTPVRRREILKKYPELFKDFPYLEKAYYREQQFTELFPTIKDAKTASEKSEALDTFERDLIGNGNIGNILAAVKEENPNSFNKIVDNLMPMLAQIDTRAYQHIIGNTVKHTILAMVKEGNKNENKALLAAAQILNQFVFASSDFVPPSRLTKETREENDSEKRVNEREQEFTRRAFTTTLGDLNTRVNNTLKNTVLANIDPKESMTDYVRNKATEDALDTLEELISKDSRFNALKDRLWEDALKNNFSKESTDRIRSAYLSKAKTLLPSVIKKARNDALRGMGKRVKSEDSVEEVKTDKKGPIKSERPRSNSSNNGNIKSAKDIPKSMSTLDFLNSD